MLIKRLSPIFQSVSGVDVLPEIERLQDLYRKEFKRNLPVDLLYSSWGSVKEPKFGITLSWDGSNQQIEDSVHWVRSNVAASVINDSEVSYTEQEVK